MVVVEIRSESEVPGGLRFAAAAERDGRAISVEVRLSWADYNLWSPDGADAPERVARAALLFLLSRSEGDPPASFDAAMLRRRFPEADAEIARLLRPASIG
ncbi:MAG TPA: hypothetical protein PKC43_02275 [Phycisphaerales bacterium]|mgnify:CR=1 FL=1|nr:hypothetical protein [Phycisphaerales bacterium]HMP36251.1 hypothetical protein [Phycisphaerales bacterium]